MSASLLDNAENERQMTMMSYRDLPKALRDFTSAHVLLPTLVLTAACGPAAKVDQSADTVRHRNDSVATTGSPPRAAVVTAAPSPSVPLSSLVDSLRRLPGEFTRSPARVWLFSGDDAVFNTLFDRGDSAVVALVDCIDRSDLGVATLAGKRVAFGVLCATALQRIASATEYEDAGDWAGVILPTATPLQLKEAKKEWKKVVAKRAYQML
jgi:hypothetical protein